MKNNSTRNAHQLCNISHNKICVKISDSFDRTSVVDKSTLFNDNLFQLKLTFGGRNVFGITKFVDGIRPLD